MFFEGILFIPNIALAQETVWICKDNTTGNIYDTEANCNKTCGLTKSGCETTTWQPTQPWWTCSINGRIFASKDACICLSGFEKKACISSTGETDIPPTDDNGGPTAHDDQLFIKFLNWLFPALLSVAAILAFLKIVFAGFKWIAAAGNPSTIQDAKDAIFKAVLGLALAFVAWLILWTINPALVGLSSGTPPTAPGANPPAAPGANPPTGSTLSNDQAVALLQGAGINITSTGGCSDPTNPSCTSLEGIPASTVTSLINIKQACNCSITITGGTETGHQTHGPGLPVVDLEFNDTLASYLKNNTSSLGISAICTAPQDAQYRYNCNFDEGTRHIHISF